MEIQIKKTLKHDIYDSERALYGSCGIHALECKFDGPSDGESAFKESSDIFAEKCFFNLRYPFWHDKYLKIADCEMTSLCRAALWYSEHIEITDTKMHGIKALRECHDITLKNCDIISPEFGWSCTGVRMEDCTAESEYFMMRSENLYFRNVHFKGKYSFQYIKNAVFENCVFDTKDAFWHAENVTIRDSEINGEYLGWYSNGVTFQNCRLSGTQPLCYCKYLMLSDCRMDKSDLSFEKSDAFATLTAPIISIKNLRSGQITVPEVGEIISDDKDAKGSIIIKPYIK